MTFHELEVRLLARLGERLRGGQISERRLARLAGYTQPHIHNVRTGRRRLHSELADALLRHLRLSVEDLIDAGAGAAAGSLAGPPLPTRCVDPFWLTAEDNAMEPVLLRGDLLLVDRSEPARRRPVFESLYVVAAPGRLVVCRCQRVGSALVLVIDNPRHARPLPQRIPLDRRDILEVVQGRVVWAGRDLEGPVAML